MGAGFVLFAGGGLRMGRWSGRPTSGREIDHPRLAQNILATLYHAGDRSSVTIFGGRPQYLLDDRAGGGVDLDWGPIFLRQATAFGRNPSRLFQGGGVSVLHSPGGLMNGAGIEGETASPPCSPLRRPCALHVHSCGECGFSS